MDHPYLLPSAFPGVFSLGFGYVRRLLGLDVYAVP